MCIIVNEINTGDIRGHVYIFEKTGDMIPMHNHDKNSVHISIIAKGSLRLLGYKKQPVEYTCGTMLDFSDIEMHELRALEDDTRMFNILKYKNA